MIRMTLNDYCEKYYNKSFWDLQSNTPHETIYIKFIHPEHGVVIMDVRRGGMIDLNGINKRGCSVRDTFDIYPKVTKIIIGGKLL